MARARLNYDRMDIRLDENRWSVDASGTLDLTANGAASDDISCDENGTYTLGDLSPKPYKPAGYGFAVDLGATYDILPELQVSVAVTDLGFISWNKKYNSTGRSVKSLEFTGVQIENGQTAEQPDFDMNLLEFTPPRHRAPPRASTPRSTPASNTRSGARRSASDCSTRPASGSSRPGTASPAR